MPVLHELERHRWPISTFEAAAQRLLNGLTGAVIRCLRRQESICVATSGGLDSSVVAAIAARHFDETIHLVTSSVPGGVDSVRARVLSRHLGLPLSEVVLTPERIRAALPEYVPLLGTQPVDPDLAKEWGIAPGTRYVSPVLAAWELPLFFAAAEARRFAPRLMVGQGADESLGGYRRYLDIPPEGLRAALEADLHKLKEEVLPVEERLAKHVRLDVRYPFLDSGVQAACRALSPELLIHEGVRKVTLRKVAAGLGLPDEIANAPKTAAQYGSGVAEILAGLADEAGAHQNEFLTGFLPQRTMGELHSLRT